METIFDHNPTPEELHAIGENFRSREWYLTHVDRETAWFDLALLFQERGDAENETRAWSHIPDRHDEYLRGFDYLYIES
ncbi:MAG: hypothetical protein J1E79_03855 [Rikenella sp.]|nr:hypothetical protein [Rikenella sp.]